MRNLKSIIITILVISVPLLGLNWYSNLPKPEPQIPQSMKAEGFHGVDGFTFEQTLAKDSKLSFGGKKAIVACPKTMLLSDEVPALCGYCKFDDFEIYPSWLPEFSMRLDVEDFDYRSFYDDALHTRFFMKTNGYSEVFADYAADGWQESAGRWFSCRNDEELDVNAYIEVVWNSGQLDYRIGDYEALGVVRKQGFTSP